MILDTIARFLREHDIRVPVLAACSGGPDSTALVIAFAELGAVPFEVAHVNHHLRGTESDADETFVRKLCERYGVPLHVVDGPLDQAEVRRAGVETAARNIRYERLAQINRGLIATAHHKNDQAETILMRLVSGSGIAALRGIHPVRGDGVIRPLLTVTRADIDRFLAERGITARSDRSNDDPRFLRNRVRSLLTQLDPGAIDNLAAIADQASAQWSVLKRAIDDVDTGIATADETRFSTLPEGPWLRRALLHRHIMRLDPLARDVSASDLERLSTSTQKRISVTATIEMIRRGGAVILRRRPQPTNDFEAAIHAGESIQIAAIHSTVSVARRKGQRRYGQAFVLPKGADPTFIVRNRRNGDRFHPLGMPREKKLKDFLIDRKIPAEVRASLPLLIWNGAIVWVSGVEISEAFKVTDGAGEIYEVSVEEEGQEGVQRESDREPRRKSR